jgi:hypothetical protein
MSSLVETIDYNGMVLAIPPSQYFSMMSLTCEDKPIAHFSDYRGCWYSVYEVLDMRCGNAMRDQMIAVARCAWIDTPETADGEWEFSSCEKEAAKWKLMSRQCRLPQKA